MEDVSLIYDRLLTQSLNVPGVRVRRADFLEKNLRDFCPPEQINKAITTSIRNAKISEKVLARIARRVVNDHTFKVTGISTLSGMPGGLAMVATIPADLAQYYYHVIILAQKLAYIYGYPQLAGVIANESDKELIHHLTLFIGVMYDVNGAREAVLAGSKNDAEVLSEVPGQALTETVYYILKKNIARWVGIKVTKKTFSQALSKTIPVVSGFVSGGISYTSFTPMARKLKILLEEGYRTGV